MGQITAPGDEDNVRLGSWLFSNSGRGVKFSVNILAGFRVLSAEGRALRTMA
jgi:hypothetical protein